MQAPARKALAKSLVPDSPMKVAFRFSTWNSRLEPIIVTPGRLDKVG